MIEISLMIIEGTEAAVVRTHLLFVVAGLFFFVPALRFSHKVEPRYDLRGRRSHRTENLVRGDMSARHEPLGEPYTRERQRG